MRQQILLLRINFSEVESWLIFIGLYDIRVELELWQKTSWFCSCKHWEHLKKIAYSFSSSDPSTSNFWIYFAVFFLVYRRVTSNTYFHGILCKFFRIKLNYSSIPLNFFFCCFFSCKYIDSVFEFHLYNVQNNLFVEKRSKETPNKPIAWLENCSKLVTEAQLIDNTFQRHVTLCSVLSFSWR